MPDYRTLVNDEMTGDVLAEIPMSFDSPFSTLMNDTGTLTGSFPADHPKATHAVIENGLRSLTVLRDDTSVWNGLLLDWDVNAADRRVNLRAAEASAWFDMRVVEALMTLNEDRFDWVRDVWSALTSKLSTAGDGTGSAGTNINASIANFSVSSGLSGFTLNSALAASGFYTFRDVLNKLAENPDEGIEWRMDYSTGSTRQTCQRTLKLGAPLGTTQTRTLSEVVLNSWGRSGSPGSSLTRAHLRGQGITSTKQNTGSLSSWPLMERAFDRGDLTDQTELDNAARETRRQYQPPVKIRPITFVPGRALPFGFCDLGDTVPIEVNDIAELLNITVSDLRVVGIAVQPPSDANPELVTLTFNDSLSATGA